MRCRPMGFPGPGCSIVAPERPFINHRERREIPVSRGRATGTGLVNSTSYRDKVPGRDTLWPTYPRESHDFRLSRFRHRDRLHGSSRSMGYYSFFVHIRLVNEEHCRSGLSWFNSVRLNCTRFALGIIRVHVHRFPLRPI